MMIAATKTLCLWPGCSFKAVNLALHMRNAHGVDVTKESKAPKTPLGSALIGPVQAITNITLDMALRKSAGSAVRCMECDVAARIVEQQTDRDGNVRRRRECPTCLTRFTTYEIRFPDND